MTPTEQRQPRSVCGGLLLLLIRGGLLWVVIPLSFGWWCCAWPFLRRRQVRLAQFLGWVDLNLVAGIERTVLRPLIRVRRDWTPASAMSTVSHRIGFLDIA